MSIASTTIWTGQKGTFEISQMVTPHLGNAIAKLKTEISEGKKSGNLSPQEQKTLLSNLEAEYSTRTDQSSTSGATIS